MAVAMRASAAVCAMLLAMPLRSNAVELRLINSTDDSVVFLYRPASQRSGGPETFGRGVSLPAGTREPVRIELAAGDPYDVQIRSVTRSGVEGVSSFMGSEVNLEELARRLGGRPADLKLAMAARKMPNGKLVEHVAIGWIIADGKEQSVFSRSEKLRQLTQSAWDTSYETQDGSRVSAKVEFNSNGNRYVTREFSGSLERVFLVETTEGASIEGTWRGAGTSGVFAFEIVGERLDQLRGRWKFSGRDNWYTWEGKLAK
jgi:hypothetical protein